MEGETDFEALGPSESGQLDPPPPEEISAPEAPPPEPAPDKDKGTGKLIASLSALLVIMWGYVLIGATMFMLIEGSLVRKHAVHPQKLRTQTLEKLMELHNTDFTLTNTTFKKEAKKLLRTHEELLAQMDLKDNQTAADVWTYEASLLFAATLVTTVGYGNIAPVTSPGRFFTIIYSVLGIPLTLVCIGMMGTIMARGFKAVAVFLFEDVVTEDGEAYIPLKVSLGVMFGYLFLGAVLFRSVEPKWTFLEAFYFCFITLSTIGLGDFVYGEDGGSDSSNFVASVAYILFGLSLLSMCFNLIQEQASYQLYRLITWGLRKVKQLRGVGTKTKKKIVRRGKKKEDKS